jgi:hypothetical protein
MAGRSWKREEQLLLWAVGEARRRRRLEGGPVTGYEGGETGSCGLGTDNEPPRPRRATGQTEGSRRAGGHEPRTEMSPPVPPPGHQHVVEFYEDYESLPESVVRTSSRPYEAMVQ